MKPTPAFATESDLCARFVAAIDAEDWIAYPETGGWDLLLVRRIDGFQIGVQAKLRFTPEVVSQCLDEYGSWHADRPGPDCRAVLVPSKGEQSHLRRICRYVGITVIAMESPLSDRSTWSSAFSPQLPKYNAYQSDDWIEHAPAKRIKLPEFVPDVPAGAKAPLKLTDWKIKAIKIAITLARRGYLVRADFKHLNIDHRIWMPRERGWLRQKDGVWIAGPNMPNYKKMHPKVWAEVETSAGVWMLRDAWPAAAEQERLKL